jgi:hypothetical protein
VRIHRKRFGFSEFLFIVYQEVLLSKDGDFLFKRWTSDKYRSV